LQIENSITDLAKYHLILAMNIFCCSTYIVTTNKLSFGSIDFSCPYFKETF